MVEFVAVFSCCCYSCCWLSSLDPVCFCTQNTQTPRRAVGSNDVEEFPTPRTINIEV